ncbi:phycobiliprotein lyase [Leptothermofonsia sp. ETS-13]|uniref:phycobiliprotein lyase n=1 Tax=Leptothermofonsia sp. ETS-13 TaxID=3035696 RepID=UPI003BA0F44E
MDVVEFFRQSAGRWRSQRTTHHLAFKQSEWGDSQIVVESLEADHPEIIELCKLHQIDPVLSVGGSRVQWKGTMEWDNEGEENHQGDTVFAIVPDEDNPHQGRLLRERGYAEVMPVVGLYHLDEEGGLVLTTEYETMSSIERFWFANPNLRLRTSTVKRFGGFSTASFCTETRLEVGLETQLNPSSNISSLPSQDVLRSRPFQSVLGW